LLYIEITKEFEASNITVDDEKRMVHKDCPKSYFWDKYYREGYEYAYPLAWDEFLKPN
jgi:hypothetical protein